MVGARSRGARPRRSARPYWKQSQINKLSICGFEKGGVTCSVTNTSSRPQLRLARLPELINSMTYRDRVLRHQKSQPPGTLSIKSSRNAPVWSTWEENGTTELIPVGSVLVGRAEGKCMMEYLALRRKSAEPPRPLSIREPKALVLCAPPRWLKVSRDTFRPWTAMFSRSRGRKCRLRGVC
jgi:hypothetical protein